MEKSNSCEERVLRELEAAEEKILKLEDDNKKLADGVRFGETVLGILRQICQISKTDSGEILFTGGYKFDPEMDGDLVNLLGKVFPLPEGDNGDKGAGTGEGGAELDTKK